MTDAPASLVGETATNIAALVRRGTVSAREVVAAHLDRIAATDWELGAFQLVRTHTALAEADQLSGLLTLPLAGVPVAIKDNVTVAGEPMRHGSVASTTEPSAVDHELVRRLRAAGAIVVGKTRVPELCIWACTDSAFGVTRNPWDLNRTPGGSSGGSAAAVGSGMVPIAHGSDGGGSIRIPAAACGLVGIKPGTGIVPGAPGSSAWCGLSANGPIATTVDDVALMLSVMAARPDLAAVRQPDRPLRIAVSTKPPVGSGLVDPAFANGAHDMAALLEDAGHQVSDADPPYGWPLMAGAGARVAVGVAEEAADLDYARLETRSKPMIRAGKALGPLLKGSYDRRWWRRRAARFFGQFDVLITPALAAPPPPAEGWCLRSFSDNIRNGLYAPFTPPWNLAGYPAMAVPAGMHPAGVPLSVQLVAADGGEALLLSVAKQLEAMAPWARRPPAYSV